MKKSIGCILSMLLIVVLVSCSSSTPAPAETSSTPAPAETSSAAETAPASSAAEPSGSKPTIRFWTRGTASNDPKSRFISDFNESNSTYTVDYQLYGENYFDMINLALQSGDPPEVFNVYSTPPVSTLAEAGHLVPLKEIMTDEELNKIYPIALAPQDFYYNGDLYTIPHSFRAYKLDYNKDVFRQAGLDPEKPPTTMEEMRTMAKQITEAGNGEYYGIGMCVNYTNFWQRWVDVFSVASGDTGMSGFDYETGRFDFSRNKRYLEYWFDVLNDGSVFPGALTLGVEQLRAAFAQGQIGMVIDGNWLSYTYAYSQDDFDWDAAALPIWEGAKRADDYGNLENTYVVAKKNKYLEESKDWFKTWLFSATDIRSYGDPEVKTVIEANTAEVMETLPKDIIFHGLEENRNVTGNTIYAIEPHKFISVEGDNRVTVFNGLIADIADGKAVDLDAALNDLTVRYNTALDKALAEGKLTQEQIQPSDFSYYSLR